MPAAYDQYDYEAYWEGREYEHDSEVIAIKSFLEKIPEIGKTLEIGGGFGRHVPNYIYRAKKVILTDPSAKNLSVALKNLGNYENLEIKQMKMETATRKFRKGSFNLVIMIRVMHHLTDADNVFASLARLLEPGGYLIFEFANKIHFKSIIQNLFKGDLTYVMDTTPIDRRSRKMVKKGTLPFINYHPNEIEEGLAKQGFKIVEKRSVSNVRNPFFKKYLPESIMLSLERLAQKVLGYVNFGPSIFILARKRG